MPEQITFGRRRTPVPAVSARIDPEALSPEAEAFRAELAASRMAVDEEFATWRRSQRPRRFGFILLSVLLLAPGLICFVLDAPWQASMGLEAAGFACAAWVRKERRRRIGEIAGWAPSDGAG